MREGRPEMIPFVPRLPGFAGKREQTGAKLIVTSIRT
jgi:hypothetical protein